MAIASLVQALPKAELHVHIEGCLPPKMVLEMGERNGLQDKLPFRTLQAAELAFAYRNLQEFLDLRDASLQVLITERDFREVMTSYLSTVAAQRVRHAEIFFDPQVHTRRGIGFEVFMPGFISAMTDAEEQYGISSSLLMCFMTELGPAAAEATLAQVSCSPDFYRQREEGPADEIWESINVLKVDRIDHGVSCLHDQALLKYLKQSRLPLTVCPLSNVKLQVVKEELLERMRELFSWELCVTVNSDDPPFFGGYLSENFQFWADRLSLDQDEIAQLALNSVEASFLAEDAKLALRTEITLAYHNYRARA